jgi:uncharacterized repeat protein (TIGR01451 family)
MVVQMNSRYRRQIQTCGAGRLFVFLFAASLHLNGAAAPPSVESDLVNRSVEVRLEQFKVITTENGQENLVAADTVNPGDIVEYRATYSNRDGKSVKGLLATLPVPQGMHYLPKTARPGPERIKVATARGVFGPEPLHREVKVNGKTLSEPVPYAEYRSIQWSLGQLAAGADAVVSARVQVDELNVTPASDSVNK